MAEVKIDIVGQDKGATQAVSAVAQAAESAAAKISAAFDSAAQSILSAVGKITAAYEMQNGKLIAGMEAQSAAISAVSQAVDGLRQQSEAIDAAMGKAASSSRDGAKTVDGFGHTCVTAKAKLSEFLKGLLQFEAIKAAARWLLDLGKSMLDIAAKAETSQIMLSRLMGSVAQGQSAFQWIMDFKAPFSLDALTNSFVKLQVAGLDPMSGRLKILTDAIAAFGGSSADLNLASVAIQQMAGKGVISMEELRQQLGERIPTAVKLMARELGYSEDQLGDFYAMVSNGGLDATKGLEALFRGLEKEYKGAGEGMMNSWSGIMAQMEREWQSFVVKIGEKGAFESLKAEIGAIKTAIDAGFESGKADEWAATVSRAIQGVILLVKILAGTVYLLYRGFEQVAAVVLGIASAIFAMAVPLGWVTDKLGLTKGAFEEWKQSAQAAWGAAGELWTGVAPQAENAADATGKATAATNKLAGEMSNLAKEGAMEAQAEEAKKLEKTIIDAGKAVTQLGDAEREFAGERFKAALEEQAKAMDEVGSLTGKELIAPLQQYLSVIDTTYGTQLRLLQQLKSQLTSAGASQKAMVQQEIQIAGTEKTLATQRLSAWQQYYNSLKSMQQDAISAIKTGEQELINIQKNAQDALNQVNLAGLSGLAAYNTRWWQLEAKKQTAINAGDVATLKQLAQEAAGLVGEITKTETVTEQVYKNSQMTAEEFMQAAPGAAVAMETVSRSVEKTVVSLDESKQKARSFIEEVSSAAETAQERINSENEKQLSVIEQAMAKASEMMELYKGQIVELEAKIADLQAHAAVEIDVKTDQAKSAISDVKALLDSITDKTVTVTVVQNTVSSGGAVTSTSSAGATEGPYSANATATDAAGNTWATDSQGYIKPYDQQPSGYQAQASYASGTAYVPKTGMYQLHQGEVVMTRNEARTNSQSISISAPVTIQVSADSSGRIDWSSEAPRAARAIKRELARLGNITGARA